MTEQSNKHFIADKYRYTLRSTGYSSTRYGNCEICNLHVSDVYIQIEEKQYQPDEDEVKNRPEGEFWTHYECRTLFGHEDCLISKQR